MVQDLEDFQDSSLQFWAFGKKLDVVLADDHLVLIMGKDQKMVSWYIMTLVTDDGAPFPSDSYMKAALSRMFYGPDDFVKQMTETYLT